MTSIESTPTPELAAMVRARCPEWCTHRTSSTPHEYRLLNNGNYAVTHRGLDQFEPEGPSAPLELFREVTWTAGGELLRSQDYTMIRQTLLISPEQARVFMAAIEKHMSTRPAAVKGEVSR